MAELEDDEQPVAAEDDSERPTLGARIAGLMQPSYMPKPAAPPPDAPPAPDIKPPLDMSKMPDAVKMVTGPSSIPQPSNQNVVDLAKKQATLTQPINPKDESGNVKPQYKMGWGRRIAGALTAAAEGFGGRPYTGPYIGPGATNARYAQDERQRQGELEGVNEQLATQEKMFGQNQKAYEDAIKAAYEEQLGGYREKLGNAAEQNADTRAQLVESEANLRKARADKLTTNPADQRAEDADKYGLTGQARKDYILTGKLPKDFAGSTRQPTELETWIEAFKRENGRPPSADEISNRKSHTKMSAEVEEQRNQAWQKARREYDQGLQKLADPSDKQAIQELREEYYQKRQDAQDNYEAGITRLGGKAQHVELPQDHFGEGGARPATQPAKAQPAKQIPQRSSAPKVGQIVTVKGKKYTVGKVYADGSWDPK